MGSNEARKKEREVLAVREAIRRLLGIDDIVVRSHESPDTIVTLPDGTEVGVEVVEPCDERVAAGMAGLKRIEERVLARLVDVGTNLSMYLRTGGGFIDALNDGRRVRTHVDALIALAEAHLASGRAQRRYRAAALRSRGIDRLTDVWVWPSESPEVMGGANVFGNGSLIIASVQKAIDDKNAKIDVYRHHLPGREVWLLVLGGTSFASGTVSFVVRDGTYVSAFDRTLYLDARDSGAFVLDTRSAARSA